MEAAFFPMQLLDLPIGRTLFPTGLVGFPVDDALWPVRVVDVPVHEPFFSMPLPAFPGAWTFRPS